MKGRIQIPVRLAKLTALLLCCRSSDSYSPRPTSSSSSTRRKWLDQTVALVATTASSLAMPATPSYAESVGELPLALRDYTKLAPLGKVGSTSLEGKTLDLPLSQLASRLEVDLVVGHTGQGGYFISGDLDESIFRDDCSFIDPTNRVNSLSQYRNALRILFDPNQSHVQLVRPIVIDEQERTLTATIRSWGVLQLPWRPYITAYESTIVYRVDDSNGLIAEQSQTWSKSAGQALQESFTPSFNRPAPLSSLPSSQTEPPSVTQLFSIVNGRRPYEYTDEERKDIARLINDIVVEASSSSQVNGDNIFRPDYLPGKWMLVYLQPGPTGVGIDRRIPFADFDFNDSFQVFGPDSVRNVGQVLGPWVQVQVSGSLREETPGSRKVPKRFVAQIEQGELCVSSQEAVCVDLPIAGEGVFDSLYLGSRLRIGQNINGGGARVVQVKLE